MGSDDGIDLLVEEDDNDEIADMVGIEIVDPVLLLVAAVDVSNWLDSALVEITSVDTGAVVAGSVVVATTTELRSVLAG